jgi:chemotaxis signal transduction protein
VLPEIISPIKSSKKSDFFFRFSIGDIPLVENALNVKEVCCPLKANTTGETFSLRGKEMPIVDCYRRFNLSSANLDPARQTVLIINPDCGGYYDNKDEECAVMVDDLDVNALFRSRLAYSVPPKTGGVFAEFTRECWDVTGGDQLMFLDWQKLYSTT